MKYLWTEDSGAGLHLWQLVNKYLFQGKLCVESKKSNQGILDAARDLRPEKDDIYYLAFDIVYDNMDIVNKFMELKEISVKYPGQIIVLDMICFEYIILAFEKLVEWTGSGRKDVISMRQNILRAIKDHRIELEAVDNKTREFLERFKHYSTEKAIKSLTYMLTDGDAWNIKGEKLGKCWYMDCCVLDNPDRKHCGLNDEEGINKIRMLLASSEIQRITASIV